jgi:hypothetical protein
MARAYMEATPTSTEVLHELEQIAKLQTDLDDAQGAKFRKRSAYQHYQRKHGRES